MMYLLLRDNKQSGPFSLEEIKNMGLKAYDLVWVEGKSAAWRYPCEIDELSAFAPPVEEQPFDRFYKKTSPVKANNNNNSTVPPKPASEPSSVPGKRIIYVTMPAGTGPTAPTPSREVVRETVRVAVPAPKPTPVPYEPTPAPVQTYGIEDNSSQPVLEEAADVEFLPRRIKRSSSNLVKPLAIGLCILALLAAGIFIGLSINKDTLPFQPKIAAQTTKTNLDNGGQQPQAPTTAQQLPAPAAMSNAAPLNTNPPADTVTSAVGETSPIAPPVSRTSKTSTPVVSSKEKPANPKNQNLLPLTTKDSSSSAYPVVHREAVRRTDATEKAESPDKDANGKLNIANQVSVGANGYTVGTFGGISDLQVTVTNRSAYPLDLVVVEVQYVQANKKVYKTENLTFRGIGAGSALMQEAPKSSRGVRVQYKITSINSKELGLSYSGI
ncbi:MAG: hypothetical protein JST68_25765 [Bacteroidetes bacterium]|nr:hypothetical protein [Bacteroidota bacterium]